MVVKLILLSFIISGKLMGQTVKLDKCGLEGIEVGKRFTQTGSSHELNKDPISSRIVTPIDTIHRYFVFNKDYEGRGIESKVFISVNGQGTVTSLTSFYTATSDIERIFSNYYGNPDIVSNGMRSSDLRNRTNFWKLKNDISLFLVIKPGDEFVEVRFIFNDGAKPPLDLVFLK